MRNILRASCLRTRPSGRLNLQMKKALSSTIETITATWKNWTKCRGWTRWMFTVLNQRRQINNVQKYHYINKSVVKEVYCTVGYSEHTCGSRQPCLLQCLRYGLVTFVIRPGYICDAYNSDLSVRQRFLHTACPCYKELVLILIKSGETKKRCC